ncbi:hypothetical protein FB45DRAFT_474826 [Roridomyces roridus]|uniref:Fe2OG dioxygenase domain-containing protein n=1 Tax=Roridomyces roridus TaxID=1738132 RepID=A0AAD7FNQ8_9AGAR|nr:hypothetical protein FB45DRAFT_474826 [Roridomyces roridus]
MEDLSYTIKISRVGYEYEGDIVPDDEEHVPERLKEWYQSGTISGYGDVKAQETKIDPEVRNAREIPASEVSVSSDLLSKVEELWGASFFPTKVRAELYKIHVYGPGGMFKAHRDTPETNLVGTFLIGLGDTCKVVGQPYWEEGALKVKSSPTEWTLFTADPGSWVAFYPDVEHSVLEIKSGYRAVIAFKIFRQLLDVPEVPADVAMHCQLKKELVKIQAPYGILLDHRYPNGTAELNGFDAALYAAAGEISDTKLLPVLVTCGAAHYLEDRDAGYCEAKVYPITEMHINALTEYLKKDKAEGEKDTSPLFVDLKGTDAEWIHNYGKKTIPFYSHSFDGTTVVWKKELEEGSEYTGNESRPYSEDSIYLSHALVLLPKRGTKRPGEGQGGKEDGLKKKRPGGKGEEQEEEDSKGSEEEEEEVSEEEKEREDGE